MGKGAGHTFWLKWGEVPTFMKNLQCAPLPGIVSTLSLSKINHTCSQRSHFNDKETEAQEGGFSQGYHVVTNLVAHKHKSVWRQCQALSHVTGCLCSSSFLQSLQPFSLDFILDIPLQINKEKTKQPNTIIKGEKGFRAGTLGKRIAMWLMSAYEVLSFRHHGNPNEIPVHTYQNG